MARIPGVALVGSIVEEARKVIWPKREIVIRHTLLVLLCVAIATVIFGAFDLGLQQLVLRVIRQ